MRAIADGTQSRRRGVGLVIHLRGILHQQHLLVAAGIRSRLLPMRLHQRFIAHMRILAEAIHGLGCGLTVLLSRDRACRFGCHRRRDHHRAARASHMSQLSGSIGLLRPLLGAYHILHFHHFSLPSAFSLLSSSSILPHFHDYSCGYKSGSGVGTLGSPWPGQLFSHHRRPKGPHSTPHRPRPYATDHYHSNNPTSESDTSAPTDDLMSLLICLCSRSP